MITEEQLWELIASGERDRVEKTVLIDNTDKFSEAITSFSNDMAGHGKPGYLLIGVRDNGELDGLKVTDQLLLNLAALRSDGNIQPLPAISVGKLTLPEGEVAVVEVQPSVLPPHRYKGRVYIRVGPCEAIATEQEETLLSERRISKASTFDALPCLEAGLGDLVLDLFQTTYRPQAVSAEVIAENGRNLEQQLAALRFFNGKTNCPTNAGLILFGKNPLAFLPGAYVQFLRVDGNTLSDPILEEKAFSGDLLNLLRSLDELLKVQIKESLAAHSTLRETKIYDYPPIALREYLMNAILHRSYSSTAPVKFYWFGDFLEIQNPGGLYGEASPENFPSQNTYRNPVVGEAMKALGYVNRFGRGVLRAKEALAQNGNPEPEYTFDKNYVGVKVWRRR